jgi:hypothetical protein
MCIIQHPVRTHLILFSIFLFACSSMPSEKTGPRPADVSVEFPVMTVGDGFEKITEKGPFTCRVINVKPDGSFILEARNNANGSVYNQYYDNRYRLVTEIDTTTAAITKLPSPPTELLKFPLFIGSKWEEEYDYFSPDGKPRPYINLFKVESEETIEIQAGIFKAFRILRITTNKETKNTFNFVYWYSPDLKMIIKSKPLDRNKDVSGYTLPYMEVLSYVRASEKAQSNLASVGANESAINKTSVEQANSTGNVSFLGNLGDYYALLIGNNEYRYLPKLKSAVHDINSIAGILKDYYRFKVEILTNATLADIITSLNRLRKTLTGKDNLLIYYAGHGILDEGADEGYWLPVDAEIGVETNWIANSFMTASIRAIAAKHVIIVADSCYAGKLTRGISIVDKPTDYFARIAAKRARTVLSSGGLEPVLDSGGKNNHSVFASAFIDALTENHGAIDATQLFSSIRRPIMLNSNQTPEYSDIRNAGHDGGDFIFSRQ